MGEPHTLVFSVSWCLLVFGLTLVGPHARITGLETKLARKTFVPDAAR